MIGITVKHFSNQFENPDWTPLLEDFGETNTDTSTYRPDISIARAQAGILSGKKLIYDFDDGKSKYRYLFHRNLPKAESNQDFQTDLRNALL